MNEVKKCLHCGKEILTKNKFCSLSCLAKNKQILVRENYLRNGCLSKNPSAFKRFLIEIRGHKCEICLNTEWQNKPIPLVLDHIDGNPSNGKIENLRLVCGNCDMQLPTYKSKNRGNGRFERMERYRNKKSY